MNVHGLKLVNNHSEPTFSFKYFFNHYIGINIEFSEIKILLTVHIEH